MNEQTTRYDFAIIGAGIVGLGTAWALLQRYPGARLLLLDKEDGVARHQTGHNSGVIHSGIYYRPGTLKARLAKAGNAALVDFCRRHEIPHEVCGKVIVATSEAERPQLEALYRRGLANELPVSQIGPEELKEIEPHAQGVAAIRVPTTGIVDYKEVSRVLADLIQQAGGEIVLAAPVEHITTTSTGVALDSGTRTWQARVLINCGGLQSDRLALLAGVQPGCRIVPFRGEYYELKPERRHLVNNLIYPVPDPDFPFLGVHFTRMIDGSVHAGPNAVLGLKREGYRWRDISLRDLADSLSYPGVWHMAARHWRQGLQEMQRSLSKAAFVRSLQRLVPEITAADLLPSPAGVRAQALMPDGTLADDFLIVPGSNAIHICNAPSPAATASLEIGQLVADYVAERFTPGGGARQTRPDILAYVGGTN